MLTKEQAIEILDKLNFFQGQRAGRELWGEKPFNVQEQDIEDFKRNVALLKEYITTADVVPKSEEGAECPTCHGTGRIGTTDWLTKGLSKKQLAEEKAKAIAEHEQHIKTEVAREIFAEIEEMMYRPFDDMFDAHLEIEEQKFAELKKKYTEGEK